MLFSEFADIMHKHCGGTFKPHEYFLLLIDKIMEDPKTPDDLEKLNNNTYNPFEKLTPDTRDRFFKGTKSITKKRLRIVSSHVNQEKFADYINSVGYDVQLGIEKDFKKRISDFNSEDDLGYSCAELFVEIIDDIIDGKEKASPILTADNPPIKSKIKEVPIPTVYISDGKIHVGNTSITLPEELLPPADIAPEEDIYINELLAAYSHATNCGVLTKESLKNLHKRYQDNFKQQRINYYSAVRIERFARESVNDGETQFEKWKSDTYNYISDTYWDDYDNGFKRLLSVLQKVVDCSTTSIIDEIKGLVSSKERKGVCHMLTNDGELQWVMTDE